ncbi:hypothetical protein FB451DRAFT_1134717 [Mycena latifolia]|nr:hypothetical protein FB451DRAFT_1134717 [Mycena latifolia]
MFRVTGEGHICGVLNDSDLSVQLGSPSHSTSTQRTGTKPFMACDLLVRNPPLHCYRFDLESLYYALLFLTCRYHDGKEVEDPPFEEWYHLGTEALGDAKRHFIGDPITDSLTPNFLPLKIWLTRLLGMFRKGIRARTDYLDEASLLRDGFLRAMPPFDDATLGGHVTFDAFEAILDQEPQLL